MEEKTDYYTGRAGAFNELIYATNLLLDNGLFPRWQVLAYHDNAREMTDILNLSNQMKLEESCKALERTV